MEIVYVPGRDNVAADVLSRFGFERDEVGTSPAARYDAGDASLRGTLVDWLHCVMPHVNFDMCVAAARTGLAASRTLKSLCCKKCHAVHLDTDDFASRLHRYHRCELCGHQWAVSPMVQGNPLAVLGPSFEDNRLLLARLPGESAQLSSVVVEPSFLARVQAAQ